MKTTSPNPTTFNPELSATLAALKFMQERTEPIFAKAAEPSLPLPQAWTLPCKTCGAEGGFPSTNHITGIHYVWCLRTECEDYHAVFTQEEWQQRGLERRAADAEKEAQ